MPLFYEHVNEFAKIAIWHIAEEKTFFVEKVPVHRKITHPHKQLQHLAGRYLLQHLYPDFPYHLMEIADTRKPYLTNEEYHFSISHCGDYAAVIVSKDHRVGIDIELVSEKINRIKHKFLSDDEYDSMQKGQTSNGNQQLGNQSINQLTLLWSCKEAIFKWYGKGGLDFKEHMHVNAINLKEQGVVQCKFTKEQKVDLDIEYKMFEDLCLAWVVTEH